MTLEEFDKALPEWKARYGTVKVVTAYETDGKLLLDPGTGEALPGQSPKAKKGTEYRAAFRPLQIDAVRALEASGENLLQPKMTTFATLVDVLWLGGDEVLRNEVSAVMAIGGELLGGMKQYQISLGNG